MFHVFEESKLASIQSLFLVTPAPGRCNRNRIELSVTNCISRMGRWFTKYVTAGI